MQLSQLQAQIKERDLRDSMVNGGVNASHQSISTVERQQIVSPRAGREWLADVFMRISTMEHLLEVIIVNETIFCLIFLERNPICTTKQCYRFKISRCCIESIDWIRKYFHPH